MVEYVDEGDIMVVGVPQDYLQPSATIPPTDQLVLTEDEKCVCGAELDGLFFCPTCYGYLSFEARSQMRDAYRLKGYDSEMFSEAYDRAKTEMKGKVERHGRTV